MFITLNVFKRKLFFHERHTKDLMAICKRRLWNVGIGIGIGIGIDIKNAIISSSIKPMNTKLSRVVT